MAAVVDYDESIEASLLVLLYLEPHTIYGLLYHCIIEVLNSCDVHTAKTIFLNVRCEVFQVIFDFRQVFKLCIIRLTFSEYLVVMVA